MLYVVVSENGVFDGRGFSTRHTDACLFEDELEAQTVAASLGGRVVSFRYLGKAA